MGKCSGLITRERNIIRGVEERIIDFVIVSNDVLKNIDHMNIEDKRVHVLTKNRKTISLKDRN